MRPDSWIALALFGLAVLYFSLTFTATLDLRDEGYLLMRSAEVAQGAVPHRDFADVYGPGVFAAAALALRVFDDQILAVRVLVALLKALAVVAGYALSRRVAPRWLAVAAAGIGIAFWGRFAANLNAPYAALFSIPLGLAATALWLRARESGSLLGSVAAGLLLGLGIACKQSLGLVIAFGLVAAAVADAWIAESAGRRRGAAGFAALFAALFALASVLPVVPVLRWLTPGAWALHLLPLHATFALVAWAGWQRGAPSLSALLRAVLPLAAGAVVVPLGVASFYVLGGGVLALLDDMFVLPFSLREYVQPAELPPAALALFFAALWAVALSASLALAARRRAATAAAGVAVLLVAAGVFLLPPDAPGLRDPAVLLTRAPFALEALYLPGLLGTALLLSIRHLGDPAALRARAPVLIVSAMLCFEVFPRAGHNLWILHGALSPLLAMVLGDLLAATGAMRAPRLRRRLAAAALLAVPCWLVSPLVRTVVWPAPATGERRPLALDRARGLRLDAVQREEQRVPHVEALVAWLAIHEPPDAPLFLLTNEEMIPFLAKRPVLYPDHSFALFLAGWGMLSPERQRELDTDPMVARLLAEPDAIVVHRPDPSATRLRRAMPRLREIVERDFRVVERFGPYRVLRRVPDADAEG